MNLAFPFVHINSCITASYFLNRETETKRENVPLRLPLSYVPVGEGGREGRGVYHDFSEFSQCNMMSIKGDKNFNTSICSSGASKPQTLGVEP